MPRLPWKSIEAVDSEATYLVFGSRLPLQGYRFVPRFAFQALRIRRQLATAEGLIGYALAARVLHKEFWTVSAWRSSTDLETFAAALPHDAITKTKRRRLGRSAFTSWTCQGDELPIAWDEVARRLIRQAEDSPTDLADR